MVSMPSRVSTAAGMVIFRLARGAWWSAAATTVSDRASPASAVFLYLEDRRPSSTAAARNPPAVATAALLPGTHPAGVGSPAHRRPPAEIYRRPERRYRC